MHGSLARYETVWRDEPLETQDDRDPGRRAVPLRADARFRPLPARGAARPAAWPPPRCGSAPAGSSSDSPDVPDRVDVSADRKAYAPGETARIHIAPPFAGEATLLVLTDRVHRAAQPDGAGGRHGCRRAGRRRLGSGRLCRGARVPPGGRREVAARPRHRPGLGRRRSGRAHAAGGVRRAGQVPAARAAPRSRCTPRPAPGSPWPRWTRASCG